MALYASGVTKPARALTESALSVFNLSLLDPTSPSEIDDYKAPPKVRLLSASLVNLHTADILIHQSLDTLPVLPICESLGPLASNAADVAYTSTTITLDDVW